MPDFVYGFMIILFFIPYIVDVERDDKVSYCRGALILAFVVRVSLLFWDVYGSDIYSLPGSGVDSAMFYRNAVRYASTGYAGAGRILSTIMGLLFRLTGNSRLYGQFLLMLCGVLAICLLARVLADLNVPVRVSRWIIVLVSLLPNSAILSALFLRESLICLLLTLSVLFLFRWINANRLLDIILSFICGAACALFHNGAVAVLAAYIIVLMLYNRDYRIFMPTLRNVIPLFVVGIILLILYVRFGDMLLRKFERVDSLEDIANGTARGGSSYARYVGNSATPLNMLIYTIPRIVYFLFSPFPWQWRGLADIIAFTFNSLFYLLAVFSAVRYFLRRDRENRQLVIALLIVLAVLTFVFAWGVSNTGTATRHRDKMVMLYALLYALCSHPTDVPKLITFTTAGHKR